MIKAISPETVLNAIPAVFGLAPETCQVRPLRGGLESAVASVSFKGNSGLRNAVVKRLDGDARREVPVYRAISGSDFAPRMFGVVEEETTSYLFLEHVRAVEGWPWRDARNAAIVMRQLARVHEMNSLECVTSDWDYESALLTSARETIFLSRELRSAFPESPLGGHLRSLERVAAVLPAARHEVRERFGTVMLHGDAHPGNVRLRERKGKRAAVFLDWGRSRVGSPFEDVSSWLQTLRYWEPAAARCHDRLLREYLLASGRDTVMDASLRQAYWVSSASNVYAGALRHHLARAHESSGAVRKRSLDQTRDCLRVIRRADVLTRC